MPKRSPRNKQSSSLPISPKEKKVEEKSSWEQRFDELCRFKANNGHCNVSQHDAQNKSLVGWVNTQRVSYKKNTLNTNYIQQLNSIGFVWDLHERSYDL